MVNALDILQEYQKLKGEKSVYLSLWQEIADFCYPQSKFFDRYFAKGNKRRRMIFDSVAERSLETFAASILGTIANPATKWINFQTNKPKLNDNRDVQIFIEDAQRKVMSVFNNPRTKFYDNLMHCLQMIGAFGTAAMFVDTDKDNVVKFRAESPSGLAFKKDFSGNIEEVYFERKYTIEQLKENKWDLPDSFSSRSKDEEVSVVRYIAPNPDFNPDKAGVNIKFAKYVSMYFLEAEKKHIHTGYFRTFPVPVAGWGQLDGEIWHDSPARVALADIKMINVSQKAMMSAVEKTLNPPLVVSSEAKFGKMNTSAGAVNVGRGNPNDTIRQLDVNGNVPVAFEWQESVKNAIRAAFFIDVFQTPETPGMTATEAMIRQQERLRGLAPKIAKIQGDLIGPITERVLSILLESGDLVLPDVLKEKSVDVQVIYLSPLTQAQRVNEASSILQYVQELGLIAQVEPTVFDKVDFDAIAEELADIRGISEKLLLPEDKVVALRDARAEQQEQQQVIQTAQQIGETAQIFNQAQQQ